MRPERRFERRNDNGRLPRQGRPNSNSDPPKISLLPTKNGLDKGVHLTGRGRCMDNIFIERLWRSLKYEEVYLKNNESVSEARAGVERYFRFYNQERLHQSLQYRTPATIWLARG